MWPDGHTYIHPSGVTVDYILSIERGSHTTITADYDDNPPATESVTYITSFDAQDVNTTFSHAYVSLIKSKTYCNENCEFQPQQNVSYNPASQYTMMEQMYFFRLFDSSLQSNNKTNLNSVTISGTMTQESTDLRYASRTCAAPSA